LEIKKIDAVYTGISSDQMSDIVSAFDVFSRPNLDDEIILDCSCFKEPDIMPLLKILDIENFYPAIDLIGKYIMMYIGDNKKIQTMSAVSVGLSRTKMDDIMCAYDVYTRGDLNDEMILDCSEFEDEDAFDKFVNVLGTTSKIAQEFDGAYVVMYVNN
jgi:hypothetical protein